MPVRPSQGPGSHSPRPQTGKRRAVKALLATCQGQAPAQAPAKPRPSPGPAPAQPRPQPPAQAKPERRPTAAIHAREPVTFAEAGAPENATPRPQFMPGNLSLLLRPGVPEDRLPAANRASQGPVTFAVAVGSQAGRPSGLQFCFFSVRAWVRTEKKQFFCLRGKP